MSIQYPKESSPVSLQQTVTCLLPACSLTSHPRRFSFVHHPCFSLFCLPIVIHIPVYWILPYGIFFYTIVLFVQYKYEYNGAHFNLTNKKRYPWIKNVDNDAQINAIHKENKTNSIFNYANVSLTLENLHLFSGLLKRKWAKQTFSYKENLAQSARPDRALIEPPRNFGPSSSFCGQNSNQWFLE